jgi:hypothetical protein
MYFCKERGEEQTDTGAILEVPGNEIDFIEDIGGIDKRGTKTLQSP